MPDLKKAKTINLEKIEIAINNYIEEYGYDTYIQETIKLLGCTTTPITDIIGYKCNWPVKGEIQ